MLSLDGKAILITGGTGSLGRALTKAILDRYNPSRLVLFSRNEFKQGEAAGRIDHPALRFFIGDVRDADRLRRAMSGIDYVIHAAAMKQIPACEYNPFEAIKTNVFGSINAVNAAIDCGVRRAIAISTDKAVNPVNCYGATKLCMEKAWIRGNAYSGAEGALFSCVRYGNVTGSRGSVIPFFLTKRREGVLPVTDKRMSRFWLTLPEAVDLVLDCLLKMIGWEIFVPKLPSFRIVTLARAIAPDAEIQEVGIRPGEKLHELLISEPEARHTLDLGERFVVFPAPEAPPAQMERLALQYSQAQPLPDGYVFSSGANDTWLTIQALRAEIARLPSPEAQEWAREAGGICL